MSSTEIWVVDDEVGIRELLSEILADEGFIVKVAENAAQARALRAKGIPALMLLDIWMPDTDGVTLLKEWKANGQLEFPVIMLSGHATIETAVEATRIGAFDVLEKPIGLQKLLATVQRALKSMAVRRTPSFDLSALGVGPLITDLAARTVQLLRERSAVLFTGETGVGIEEAARALQVPGAPWVIIETGQRLISSPLAILEQGKGGHLYCADVVELSRSEQRSLGFILARAAANGTKVVCGSSEPLANLVAEGLLDNSLFAMLSACTAQIPPLRQRRSDIGPLIDRFLKALGGQAAERLSPEARALLEAAQWPGNLVQLQSALASVFIGEGTEPVSAEHLSIVLGTQKAISAPPEPAELTSAYFGMPLRDAREAFERSYFRNLLKQEEHNMSRVAEAAGLERTHLYRKLKQLDIRFARRGAAAEEESVEASDDAATADAEQGGDAKDALSA